MMQTPRSLAGAFALVCNTRNVTDTEITQEFVRPAHALVQLRHKPPSPLLRLLLRNPRVNRLDTDIAAARAREARLLQVRVCLGT